MCCEVEPAKIGSSWAEPRAETYAKSSIGTSHEYYQGQLMASRNNNQSAVKGRALLHIYIYINVGMEEIEIR